jgi:predicted Rdx family selenoprotein
LNPCLKIVMCNKRKWLLRLSQNGKETSETRTEYVHVVQCFPVESGRLTSHILQGWNVETSYCSVFFLKAKTSRKRCRQQYEIEMLEEANVDL